MNNSFFYNAYVYFTKLNKVDAINNDTTQIVGYFDEEQSIWYNAWSMSDIDEDSKKYAKSKELLMYGLNINNDMKSISGADRIIIRSMLTNSKFYITERLTQFDIMLATICYLLKATAYLIIKKNKVITCYVQVV